MRVMDYNEKLLIANSLIITGKYAEALDYIEKDIMMENIHTRLLKAQALFGLKRYDQLRTFFEGDINYCNPKKEDEMVLDLNIQIFNKLNKPFISEHYAYIKSRMIGLDNKDIYRDLNDEMDKILDGIINGLEITAVDMYHLSQLYYIKCDLVRSVFYYSLYFYLADGEWSIENELEEVVGGFYNFGEIFSLFSTMDFSDSIIFVIDKVKDYKAYLAMATVLKKIGKSVVIFKAFKEAGSFFEDETKTIQPTLYEKLFDLLESHNQYFYIFAEETTLDQLTSEKISRKYLHYLVNANLYKNQTEFTAFAYMGDYLKYISNLYNIDVRPLLERTPDYSFSIVIPVRNNIETLKHTLRTCLEINYENFEIVVSDNSDDNELKYYIEGLNSPKINYYKTPINLHLTKSFEYACLMAKGEFLIPIGADEGVLKKSLGILDSILKQYPDDDIFSWGTLSYNWPKTLNASESDKLVIGEMFSKHDQNAVQIINSSEKLLRVIKQEDPILTMPTIYQRSGMRKRFLLKLLEKTGGLMYGISQDVYMGVQILISTERYIYINKPIVMIGNSSYSIGAQTLSTTLSAETIRSQTREILISKRANAPHRYMNKMLPMVPRGYTIHFLVCLFNLADRGLVKEELLVEIKWENMFTSFIEQLSEIAVDYERNRDLVLMHAKLRLPEYAKTLTANMPLNYNEIYKLYLDEKCHPVEKNYEVGFRRNGSLSLDGQKFGISNIYEAVRFIENIVN